MLLLENGKNFILEFHEKHNVDDNDNNFRLYFLDDFKIKFNFPKYNENFDSILHTLSNIKMKFSYNVNLTNYYYHMPYVQVTDSNAYGIIKFNIYTSVLSHIIEKNIIKGYYNSELQLDESSIQSYKEHELVDVLSLRYKFFENTNITLFQNSTESLRLDILSGIDLGNLNMNTVFNKIFENWESLNVFAEFVYEIASLKF